MKTEESMQSLGAQIYNNLVLYPKGTSQMAKTILAPFTHARNFISAAAFAALMVLYRLVILKMLREHWMHYSLTGI